MKILAFDQSSNITGYSFFDNEELKYYGKFSIDGTADGAKLGKIRNKVAAIIDEYQPDHIIFEDIQMQNNVGNNVQTFKVLSMVLGVLTQLAAERGIPYSLALASSWKSALGIKGANRAAQKKAAQDWVISTYEIKPTQDECDAICIGAAHIKSNSSWAK